MAKTTHQKGLELEIQFAEFIKEEMGYEKTKIRFQVKQANNSRGANVDVIGQKLNENGKKLNRIGTTYIIVCFFPIIFSIIIGLTDSVDNILVPVFFFGGITLNVLGIIVLIISSYLNIENAWVECKNLKTKVNIGHVGKMINEIKSYKQTKDTQYKFKEFFFVSASGFVDNAIELAISNNINCYVVEDEKFKKITNWN